MTTHVLGCILIFDMYLMYINVLFLEEKILPESGVPFDFIKINAGVYNTHDR